MGAIKVGVVGDSGSGKTTSIFNLVNFGYKNLGLKPSETVILSPTSKELPIKGANTLYPSHLLKISEGLRYIKNLSPDTINNILKEIDKNPKLGIKQVIIDDAQYMQSLYLMDKVDETGYGKFTETAVRAYSPIKTANSLSTNDLIVIFIYHTETDSKSGKTKIKTSGQMVDSTLNGLDGFFTLLLYSECRLNIITNKVEYVFHTHNNGKNTCKSPIGMFTEDTIPNDLGLVCETIREFYK
jgi:ABC-type dipeptide/oligopeptide/nickel transport system ATPase component